MGKGDTSDCAGGFKSGATNQLEHIWNTDLKQFSLQQNKKNVDLSSGGYFVIFER
jgi:hypothetical protein